MEYPLHQIDNTLIKIVLNSVQDGDLSAIKQNVIKFNLNMNLLIEKDSQQNAFFFYGFSKK